MRFYTHLHKYYCGIDLHARVMYVCITDAEGSVLDRRSVWPAGDHVRARSCAVHESHAVRPGELLAEAEGFCNPLMKR